MFYRRFDTRLQVRYEAGERALDPLIELLRREGIGYATVTGLGAVRWARLAYWNALTREYEPHEVEEQLEVVSLIGNVTQRDGEPFLHWHVSLGRSDLSLFGGHFLDAVVNPSLEVWVQTEPAAVVRAVDEASGLALMQLPERG